MDKSQQVLIETLTMGKEHTMAATRIDFELAASNTIGSHTPT